jgi:hypothetical protein
VGEKSKLRNDERSSQVSEKGGVGKIISKHFGMFCGIVDSNGLSGKIGIDR